MRPCADDPLTRENEQGNGLRVSHSKIKNLKYTLDPDARAKKHQEKDALSRKYPIFVIG